VATYRSKTGVQWANVERAVNGPTQRVVDAVARDTRDNLSAHNRTGALLESFRVQRRHLGGDLVIGTDHWAYIEYGTAPHEIEPVRRRALDWEGAAHPVRRSRHPGTREYAPMRRALRQRRNVIAP
jgi:hypothetical protein